MEKIFVAVDNDRVELTGAEKEAFLAQRAIDLANAAAKQTEAEAKATQRQAILARLGITEEEARILLGGN